MEHFVRFFAFPVNLVFAVLWLTGCLLLWRHFRNSCFVRFMVSPVSVFASVGLFLGSCLWIGCTGQRDFLYSWVFITVLVYLQTVLLFVLIRGFRSRTGRIRIRFVLNHAGLLLALAAAFWGNPDNVELRMKLFEGEMSDVAYRMDGGKTWLKEPVQLKRLLTETYADGTPMQYHAVLQLGEEDVEISVNHPYSSGMSETIYLASMGDGYCILQIVREPWRHFALAGIVMLIAGALLMFIKGPVS